MNFYDWLKKRMLKWLGLEHLSEDPNSIRLTFVNGDDRVWRQRVQEYGVWYSGDSDKLSEYYLGGMAGGIFASNFVANRSKPQYFWGITTKSNERVKKTHSGLPRAMVDTLVNIIDTPTVSVDNDTIGIGGLLNAILRYNNFNATLTQEARAMTLVEGWGAWKPNINKSFSRYVTLQYYKATDCEFIYKDNILIGIVYKDYYDDGQGRHYLLCETRYTDGYNSYIKYELFKQDGENVTPCEMSELPALGELHDLKIDNYPYILGVPNIYFYDQFHKGYGRSIYAGKLDIFDDLDQCLSQASNTTRLSTPVEYMNAEFLRRGPNGQEAMPDIYCRRYIMLEGEMDANGAGKNEAVKVTQPDLNIDAFAREYNELKAIACSGILSVTTMGDISTRVANANSEREREKVTIMTRYNIITKESESLRQLFKIMLDMQHYMDTGSIEDYNFKINIKYNEFANPTFENQLRVLGNAWSMGQLSTEQYIKLLWKDRLSAEQMRVEAERLEAYREGGNNNNGFNAYNINERAESEAGETDGISDNPNNQ